MRKAIEYEMCLKIKLLVCKNPFKFQVNKSIPLQTIKGSLPTGDTATWSWVLRLQIDRRLCNTSLIAPRMRKMDSPENFTSI